MFELVQNKLILKIPQAFAAGGLPLERILSRLRCSWAEAWKLREVFLMSPAEKIFVKKLLNRHSNFWVYRCNQKKFCGDFILVDMSAPDSVFRRSFAVELKMGAPLKVGAGGIQLKNRDQALLETGVCSTLHNSLLGDPQKILDYLGRVTTRD